MICVNGIWLPHPDPRVKASVLPKSIAKDGTYHGHRYHRAARLCRQKRVAIDVGAHVGTVTRLMAREFAQVVAYEPSKRHWPCFARNVTAENVTVYNCAVGERDGLCALHGNPQTTIRVDPNAEDGTVPMVRLDSYDWRGVDFLKIDVEGFELAVLRGAEELLRRWRPVVLIEQKASCVTAYGFGTREALDYLAAMGAVHHWTDEPDHCLAWP